MNEIQQVTQPDQNQELLSTNTEPVALTQSDVNNIVGSARLKGEKRGYEKGYNEALASLQSQNNQSQSLTEQKAREIAEQTIADKIKAFEENSRREAATQYGHKVLTELGAKINQDKQSIPDFDNVVNLASFQNAPEILHLANMVDNSGHVLYDLKKNPEKLVTIASAVRNGFPDDAMTLVRQLSDSIKANQNAINQPKSPEPLSQIKPSNIGLDNGSGKTAAELRKNPRYRG